MSEKNDRELGMHRTITRRDFLNGVALGAAGLLAAPHWASVFGLDATDPEKAAGYYPPAVTGMRGSHEGSYAAAHALRDGSLWDTLGPAQDTGEEYDLVVVGAGLSGLAGAYWFRSAQKTARVLILDNHDDFGGHAKRNELRHGERTLLGYGGTWSIDSPAPYSAVARGLVAELGIDVSRWKKVNDGKLYGSLGLRPAIFFDKETFGADRLLPDPGRAAGGEDADVKAKVPDPWPRFLAEAPMSEAARRDVARIFKDSADYMPGLGVAEKRARLARMSYRDYLLNVVKADAGALPFFQARPHPLYGVGIDAMPAQDAWGLGFPGFSGLGLDAAAGPGMNRDSIPNPDADRYFFHFPDGNASLARLLVRRLIPGAIPGHTADDVVTARADYARLDDAGSAVRLRLNSTVVRVRHRGDPATASEVEVGYVRGEKLHTVRARRCLLACWGVVIPYIAPELPANQRDGLAYGIKVPIVYTNVLVRDWTAFHKLGTHTIHAPGSYHSQVNLDLPVSLGDYHCSGRPEEPILLHLMRTPCSPGQPARMQHVAGRVELLGTPFETFEREIRGQLGRMLGPGGFDPARDVEAITVNRWPHGYAYQYNSLWDPFWLEGGEQPCVVGRAPFGRLAIANADAGAYAYTDGAFDQAHRAVQELLALKG